MTISNSRGEKVFEKKQKTKKAGLIQPDQKLKALEEELQRTGVSMETVLGRYHLEEVSQMTAEIYANAMNSLKKTRSKAA